MDAQSQSRFAELFPLTDSRWKGLNNAADRVQKEFSYHAKAGWWRHPKELMADPAQRTFWHKLKVNSTDNLVTVDKPYAGTNPEDTLEKFIALVTYRFDGMFGDIVLPRYGLQEWYDRGVGNDKLNLDYVPAAPPDRDWETCRQIYTSPAL